MTQNAMWHTRSQKALMKNYAQAPVAFLRGQGTELWDADGKRYLDFAAGVAVCSTGHAHPRLVKALQDQAAQLIHTSNLYVVPNQVELAERLADLSGLDGGAFFCNSGTEAVEAALKLARAWGRLNGGRLDIISTHHAFHGRTMGALTATGTAKYKEPFEPLVPGITHVAYGRLEALEAAITPKTCAIILEPVQGEGGVIVPSLEYLQGVRRLCDERDLLLILDEVQTGIGRTGAWFAHQHAGIQPDIIALAKGLGSGVPIGAVIANARAAVFQPGHHGSTFGGNPLACAAALATLDIIEDEAVLSNVRRRGAQLRQGLATLGEAHITRVRGAGLLIGFDLVDGTSKDFASRLMQAGLLVSNIGERTIRLAPPLTVTAAQVDEALSMLRSQLTTLATATT
jgi:acetylornithine/N-succinyldiaminopimelate aminotransferase